MNSKLGIKIKIDNLIFIVYTLGIFMLKGYTFFLWDTYSNVAVKISASILHYLGFFPLLVWVLIKKNRNIKLKEMIVIFVATLVILHTSFAGAQIKLFSFADIQLLLVIISLVILNDYKKQQLFEYIFKIFTILILPSYIYYLLDIIGIELPYDILMSDNLAKREYGWYYKHYFMGLIINQVGHISRFTGIFDEAGYWASIAALLLAAGYKKIDKKWYILLLIEGFFSFSMAFYILFTCFFLIQAYIRGAKKLILYVTCFFLGFFLFMSIDFKSDKLSSIQERIDFTSFFFIKDNRITEAADSEINLFVENGGYPLWFGNGKYACYNNSNIQGQSYKFLLYDYGVVGTILYVSFFVIYVWINGYKRSVLPFLAIFLMSIYQRPYVFTITYVSIFVTALSYINQDKRIVKGKTD